MRLAVFTIACALPLAACNKGPEVHEDNASVGQVANKVAEAAGGDSFVRPGRWESKVTIEEMSIPGMPKEAAAHMGDMKGHVETSASCLTPEDVKRPKEDFFAGENKSCKYEHFDMAGGKIDALMRCASGGTSQEMTLVGNYTPDTYSMRMAMNSRDGGSGVGAMSMKMHVDAKLVGECRGDES